MRRVHPGPRTKNPDLDVAGLQLGWDLFSDLQTLVIQPFGPIRGSRYSYPPARRLQQDLRYHSLRGFSMGLPLPFR